MEGALKKFLAFPSVTMSTTEQTKITVTVGVSKISALVPVTLLVCAHVSAGKKAKMIKTRDLHLSQRNLRRARPL